MCSRNIIIQKESEIIKSNNKALDLLKTGNFDEACEIFLQVLKENYSNTIAESGVKCSKYWISRINKINQKEKFFDKGQLLFEEWKKFEKFISSIKNIQKKVSGSIMFYIFSTALDFFKKDLKKNKILDIQTSFMIALSYKKIGDFNNAIKYFEEVLSVENFNSNTLAQLADCYALIDQDKKAKLIFREAFFIDPSSIDLLLLDSNIITYLISKILEMNIAQKEIAYWIPILGRILGVFNVFRELLPVEISKIRREIFYLEKNFINDIKKDYCLKTKLLNLYFWLFDYLMLKPDKKEPGEILEKIETIQANIYTIFIDNLNKSK